MTNFENTTQNSEHSTTLQTSSEKKLRAIVYVLAIVITLQTIILFYLIAQRSSSEPSKPQLLIDQSPASATPSAEVPQETIYDDGTYSFVIPSELYISKDSTNPGVPYLELKTKNKSSIQVNLSSELELSCVEIVSQEVININGVPLNKVYYNGIRNSELINCQADNSSFRAVWVHLPIWLEKVGRPTLAVSYDLVDEQTALKVYGEILETLTFTSPKN